MIALALAFAVRAAAMQDPAPEGPARTRTDCSRGVDFHALITPETVYVGQQATYQLGVYIDQDTRTRLRRNPEFLPPESRSMLSYDLPDRGGGGGGACEAHYFRRALFPLTPGRYVIPPARLTYSLPQSPSFFSREENYSLRSEGVTLVAIDPPTAGRPADWSGAVGSWRATARIDTSRARAGDPIVVTLRIEGQGNVTLLPRPQLTIGWASVVAADERVHVDSTPTALRGSKEFDWLVIPSAAGAQRVPAIRFTYFNPFSRRYEVEMTQPLAVRVAAGDVVAPDEAAADVAVAKPFALRSDLGDETPPLLGSLTWVRALLAVAPFPAVLAWLVRRPRRRRRAATPMERLRSMTRANAAGSAPADVRRAFLDGLRARTGLEAGVLADPGAWTQALRLEGVSDATAGGIEALLDELDQLSFGRTQESGADVAGRAAALLAKVQVEARVATSARPRVLQASGALIVAVSSLALVGAAGALFARDVVRAREPFAQGMTAYAGADFVRAARLFEDAARNAPRSAAAWANAGTAAWASRDTASAVVGWQRALRLDPTAPELRGRLALVRAPQDVGPARVLAMPARFPSSAAILLWLVGWAFVVRQCWRRQPAIRLAFATVIVAGGIGAGAYMFERRLDGRGYAVVTDPTGLRVLPALGAEAGPVPLVGEVAHVVRRQGVWTHISLDGGRDGWIATERVALLGRD